MSRRMRCACVLLIVAIVILAERMSVSVLHASSSSDGGACVAEMRTTVSAVTMHLVDRVGLPRQAVTEMMRETTELWRKAGVDVTWSPLPALGTEVEVTDGSHPQMKVIVMRDTPDGLQSIAPGVRVMASILFIDRKPTTLIAAYPAEVERLLDTVHTDARPVGERPAALRQRLMGRMLGRAVAHELGHFLFGSADHTPDGLMRARHRLDDLTSPFSRAFRILPAQARTSALGSC